MKKPVILAARIALTVFFAVAFVYAAHRLEYLSQLTAVDNLIGALPLFLIAGITGFLIALVWKGHKGKMASTATLFALAGAWSLMLIPALTGNWYPFAQTPQTGSAAPDLTLYTPFADDTKAAVLPEETERLSGDLPRLDGATALYPVYAAFVNAIYNEEDYTPDLAVCTNTPGAYNSIITGGCDIIFVAGPSARQKQAAQDAGAELVFTPIGREAFVFLNAKTNPVDGLSIAQLRNIYSGKTARWSTLGWKDGGRIIVFQRPEGSGSQTGLQNIMGSLPIQKPQPLPDDSLIGSGSMMQQISVEWQGVNPAIGYSYRYYATTMYPNPGTKLLSINGIEPSLQNIADGSYPFAADFYAVTRGKPVGMTARLIDWILSEEGQYLIEQTGYVPLR